jgi:hypothetical protein
MRILLAAADVSALFSLALRTLVRELRENTQLCFSLLAYNILYALNDFIGSVYNVPVLSLQARKCKFLTQKGRFVWHTVFLYLLQKHNCTSLVSTLIMMAVNP